MCMYSSYHLIQIHESLHFIKNKQNNYTISFSTTLTAMNNCGNWQENPDAAGVISLQLVSLRLRLRLLSFPESLDLTVSLWCHHHHPVSHILPHQTAQTLHNKNYIKQQQLK